MTSQAVEIRRCPHALGGVRDVDIVQDAALIVHDQDRNGFVLHEKIRAERQVHAHGGILDETISVCQTVSFLLFFSTKFFKQLLGVGDQFRPLFHGLHPKFNLALLLLSNDGGEMLRIAERHQDNGGSRSHQQHALDGSVLHQS